MGIRFADNATAWPAGITTGATWSRDLIYRRAHALAQEARGKGIHISLGPSVGPLGRAPRAGRNWEGFGSDPYLQGEGAYLSVKVFYIKFAMDCDILLIHESRVCKMLAFKLQSSTILAMNKNISAEMEEIRM